MATPKKVDLKIMSLEDAKQLIQNDESDTKTTAACTRSEAGVVFDLTAAAM